jgi:hypothetical protein
MNEYTWTKGIKYICKNCHFEINFLEAIFDGRVSKEPSGNCYKKKKKR